jgi:hypothetical protein
LLKTKLPQKRRRRRRKRRNVGEAMEKSRIFAKQLWMLYL